MTNERADTLTSKQDAYARARAEGLNASDAYRRAYDAENMAPATIWRKAFDLEHDGKVAARVAALRAAVDARAVSEVARTAADLARFHWSIIENEEAPLAERLRASSLEMRRYAEYSDKHEVASESRIRLEALAAVAQLTPEQMRTLAEQARRPSRPAPRPADTGTNAHKPHSANTPDVT